MWIEMVIKRLVQTIVIVTLRYKTRDGSLSCRIENASKTENRPLSCIKDREPSPVLYSVEKDRKAKGFGGRERWLSQEL